MISKIKRGRDVGGLMAYLFGPGNPWTLVLVTRDPDLVRRCDQVLQLGQCHLSEHRHPNPSPAP